MSKELETSIAQDGEYKGQELTGFKLQGGTKFKLGSLEVILARDADFFIVGRVPYDGLVETIFGSGNGDPNKDAFAYKYKDENGDTIAVTYGANAVKQETKVEDKLEPDTNAVPADGENEPADDLEKKSKAELLEIATEKGLDVDSKMTKAEIIEAIHSAEMVEDGGEE